jgi:tRNA pseudouridine38-40 synthase
VPDRPRQGQEDGGSVVLPTELLRLRLDLGYDGTDFSGWAEQPGLRTVAGVLRTALATVLRVGSPQIGLVVAGRTDAGVHATGQVCHADLPPGAFPAASGRSGATSSEALLRRLAGVLPDDVRVHGVSVAPAGFDARFSALRRRYAFRISDEPTGVAPLRRRDVLSYRRPLRVEAMDDAAHRLTGLHDFAAFCRRRQGATTVRTLLEYTWRRDLDGLLVGHVVADAFCHSMVRALVGAVIPVGDGRRPVSWPSSVLVAAQRDPAVVVVPAHGLCLEEVVYPPDDQLADRARASRAVRSLAEPTLAERTLPG